MAPRSSWKGYIKLSLVSCPVRLYPAVSGSERVSFNLLHKDTKNRINMKPVDPELGLVERSDLVKGYEYEKNQYVVIDEADLDAVRIEASHTMNIEAFVDADEVDVVYMDAPYYLAPDGKMADETFVVLREAMKRENKIAIARIVMSSRERVVAISPRGKGMLVATLRNPNEVRGTSDYFDEIPDTKVDAEMLELATKLIEQKVAPFTPKNYEDRYEQALLEMIRAKLKGQKPVFAAEPARGNVVNLMDALKASLGQAKPPAPSKSKAKAAASAEEEETEATAAKGKSRAKAAGPAKATAAKAAPAARAPGKRKSA